MNMKELVERLNKAAKSYYSEGYSIMSDKEYDALYAELEELEKERGIVLTNSPTRRVGYEVVSDLPKRQHWYPALSLDKTKARDKILHWMGIKRAVLSYKMDGLTLVATYADHKLSSLVTRGNGHVGDDVTHNAPYIAGVPATVPYGGNVTIRGEAVIYHKDFAKINQAVIDAGEEPYANSRNLAASSVRLLDTKKTAGRCLRFKAFSLVNPYVQDNPDFPNTEQECFKWMEDQGFDVVAHALISKESFRVMLDSFSDAVESLPYPVDGLVLTYNDIDRSLGSTGKYPRYSMAFKWADNTAETILRDIKWSASKSGLLNPVAIFDPVELEGTTVRRASLHNISYIRDLRLNIGDTITIYKANMIIPQVDENLTGVTCSIHIPEKCPVCGGATERRIGKNKDSEFLYCVNPDCPAKHIGRFERLVHRDGLNVSGVSKATLQSFVSAGFISEPADLFHLERYREQIMQMDGFGERSYDNIMEAIEAARNTTFRNLFYALGIPNAGHDVAKLLDGYFNANLQPGQKKSMELLKLIDSFPEISGIGDVTWNLIRQWFSEHEAEYMALLGELTVTDDSVVNTGTNETEKSCTGLTFVITGNVSHFKNRAEMKAFIEEKGGNVSGSVSSKTSYLINNDVDSMSGKNKKAKELGIEIISESRFLELFAQ